ncbi:hypothetical protein BDN72DRAFT_873775 [Pluteus cervinus]|uniref:Uncharacterized protein n=1 Tax=Pluteus cervinus TaxID=181527 RepID=A0ACD3BHI2_9AGAR|nr:hypothetical protein BDN72DRAFT_873775 [Pluteus cervinus]
MSSFSAAASESESDDGVQVPPLPRKRPRAPSSEVLMAGDPDEGPTKTRRVNPERLAGRLDPNLVEEMEAHIIPGAKMPTFEVRKDLQERYNVDRRHIYDYFHSRGLRVAKEDKHINLLRVRSKRAQAQAAAAALVQVRLTNIIWKPKETEEPTPLSQSTSLEGPMSSIPSSPSTESITPVEVHGMKPRPKVIKHRKSQMQEQESTPATPPLMTDASFSDMQCPELAYPEEDVHTENTKTSLGLDSFCIVVKDEDDFYDHPLDSLSTSYLGSPMLGNYHGSMLSEDEARLLTKDERMEFYNLVDSNLGSTSGLLDSPRVHRVDMARDSHYQSATSLSGDYPSTLGHGTTRTVFTSDLVFSCAGMPVEDVDFCSWMLTIGDGQTRFPGDTLTGDIDPCDRSQGSSLDNAHLETSETSTGRNEAVLEPAKKGERLLSRELLHVPFLAKGVADVLSPSNTPNLSVQNMRPSRPRTFSAGGGI